MLIYVLNIAITILLAVLSLELEKKNCKKWIIIFSRICVILFPSILAGIRYAVGTDYLKVYNVIFEESKLGIYNNRGRNIEIGYILINKFVQLFNGEFPWVMFISSLITNTFFVLGIYNYKDKLYVPAAVGIYLLMYYQISFNAVRQMIAQSIIFYAIIFLNKKDEKPKRLNGIIKYEFFVLIAILFHKSAAIMFAVPLINIICNQTKIKNLDIVLYAITLFFVINCNLISNFMYKIPALKYYAHYLKSPQEIKISIWYFVKVLPLIIPYFLVREEIKKDKSLKLLFSLTVLGVILTLLGYFTIEFGERVAIYLMMFQIIIAPAYINILKDSNKTIFKIDGRAIFILAITLYTIFYISYWYHDYIYKNMHETVPYRTIFIKDRTRV